MKNFIKIDAKEIKLGIRFTSSVFFEDGKNMFLAEGKPVKPYHLDAILKWKIPYFLTYGHVIPTSVVSSFQSEKNNKNQVVPKVQDDAEELEPLEEAECVEEAQPVDDIPEAEPVEEAQPVDDVEPVEDIPEAEPV